VDDYHLSNITKLKEIHKVKDTKNHKNKGLRKGLSLTFKWGTKQNYVIQKQKHITSKKNLYCNLSKASKKIICDYFGHQNKPK